MKLAEQSSHEDVTSQTSEELTALEEKLNKFVAWNQTKIQDLNW